MKTRVETTCKGDRRGETTDADGTRVVHICTSEVMASALSGLKEARASIASSKEMSGEIRSEV